MGRLFLVPTKKELKAARYATTVYLGHAYRVAIHELQIKRMEAGRKKPSLKQIIVEALNLLFKKEKIKLDEH
jgi:hypothetical protein